MSKKFEHPFVVGIVDGKLNSKKNLKLKRLFNSLFKKRKMNCVYLLLKTEPSHLKNVIKCMQAMDVVGVNIADKYSKKMFKILTRLDKSAKTAKRVNLIAKKGPRFTGYYVENILKDSLPIWFPS